MLIKASSLFNKSSTFENCVSIKAVFLQQLDSIKLKLDVENVILLKMTIDFVDYHYVQYIDKIKAEPT